MKLEIDKITTTKIYVHFSKEVPAALDTLLIALEAKKAKKPYSYSIRNCKALLRYLENVKAALTENKSWHTISITPSYTTSLENITGRKFHIVHFNLIDGSKLDYLIFDTHTPLVILMAKQYAVKAYPNKLKEITYTKRSGQGLARELLQDKKIIDSYTPPKPAAAEKAIKITATRADDYIDKVIAHMHIAYGDKKRMTKAKIEKLLEVTGAPNLGALWEAVELSWLLWYQKIYRQPFAFGMRLAEMIDFWNTVQPTYSYSDSSKELYKQYSTPCPLGAIISEYTYMYDGAAIFEPSAGNGLLVLGGDPKKTHVNEIDTSRLRSLSYQQFFKVTHDNAAKPFPEEMTKKYDVVVTNPPFASWEEPKAYKKEIIETYFGGHYGMARHIRLEHLMAGLALHTLKDNGRAAIIIMGHMHFDHDGIIAKYRPFYNWLFRHYYVDDIINLNSYKLYNKQGAVAKTMLILIRGRKPTPEGVPPTRYQMRRLEKVEDSFLGVWQRICQYTPPSLQTCIYQLKLISNDLL